MEDTIDDARVHMDPGIVLSLDATWQRRVIGMGAAAFVIGYPKFEVECHVLAVNVGQDRPVE